MNLPVANHEAAHAVIGIALGLPVRLATIEPAADRTSAGRVEIRGAAATDKPPVLPPHLQVRISLAQIAWACAGDLADGAGSAGDEEIIEQEAQAIEEATGIRPPLLPIYSATSGYLKDHWETVQRLALVLLEERTISGERAREVVGELPALNLDHALAALDYAVRRAASRGAA
jgi:hypothetical protein